MATALRNAIIAASMIVLVVGSLGAQGVDPMAGMGGTRFVVAFPDTTKNTFDARYPNTRYEDKCFFFIYSAVDNVLSIKGRGYQRSGLAIAGGKFTIVDLMGSENRAPNPLIFEHCKPVDNTFTITADSPVIVYQYMVTKFGAEAWCALPVDAWGKEYYAAANPGEVGSDVSPGGEFDYNRKNKAFPAEILVIAAYDDTKITIVPNAQVQNFCNPTAITLKAGEAYQIQSWVDTLTANVGGDQPDFAGSRIFATKPVGVISGNTRAQLVDENIGLGKNTFKNMYVEWLSPVELHGTEFVYMPMVDVRSPRDTVGEDMSEKRRFECVRIYGTSENPTTGTYVDSTGTYQLGQIEQARFEEIRVTPYTRRAAVYRTDNPAQAMMSSAGVVRYAGTTGGFYIGAAYDGWGGSMSELVPRTRWSSFAPYYASVHPAGMLHYINVVTDTAHRNDVILKTGEPFVFDRLMPNTDLIWGTMSVQPGIDNWLTGRNGARFSGYVYGTLSKGGHEEYRPGAIGPRDVDPPTGPAGAENAEVMHPSEYEEYLAIAYAYPLASLLNVRGAGDSLRIGVTSDCNGATITIEVLNGDPAGLKSVRLEGGQNAKIVSQNPYPITSATDATVVVGPINLRADASATLVITDRTGKITRVAFTYYPERINIDPPQLMFGLMSPGTPKTMTVNVDNPLGRAITVKNIRLLQRNPAFTIKSPPAYPFTIRANDSITIAIEASPTQPDRDFLDTVEIELECTRWRIPVNAMTAEPCLNVNDLDFGTLSVEEARTLPLRICNDGGGEVTFNNSSGGAVVEWLETHFKVSQADIDKVRNARLLRGDCIEIMVTFSSTTEGAFATTARFWTSTRTCRDTSVWVARVTPSTSASIETGITNSLGTSRPNPFTLATEIEYTLARAGHATLVVYNARGERVATLVDREIEAGSHSARFDAARLPAGVYHCRLGVGDFSQTRTIVKE